MNCPQIDLLFVNKRTGASVMAEAADASEVPAVGSSVKLNPFVCGSLAVGLVKRVELVLDCIPYQSHGAQRRVYRIEVTPDEI